MQTALLDTNVLFSRLLRDTFVHLHFHKAFRIVWTEDIMAELVYRLRRRFPDWSENQVGGVRRNLVAAIGAEPITGHPSDGFADILDPNDRHLDAAAEYGNVDYVITTDKKAMVPDPDKSVYEYFQADDFLVVCDDSMPELVRMALLTNLGFHISRAKKLGSNFEDFPNFPEKYHSAGTPVFAERVRGHFQRFDMSRIWADPPKLSP